MTNNPALPPIAIALIAVPFDQDQHRVRMGNTPQALLDAGLRQRLAERQVDVQMQVEIGGGHHKGDLVHRIGVTQQRVAGAVAEALRHQLLPVVLGGDCLNAVGVWAGIQAGLPDLTTGVAWFDAHGDWNTEETSTTGYLGGMPFAAICGYGNARLRAQAGVERIAPPQLCAAIGVRDLDEAEEQLMRSTPLAILTADQARSDYSAAVDNLTVIDAIMLHFDMDVLSLDEAPSVTHPVPGGLSIVEAVTIARGLIANKPLVALTLTAIDPVNDADGTTLQAGIDVLLNILSD